MRVVLKAFMPEAKYFDGTKDDDSVAIEFNDECKSTVESDIEMIVNGKRYWINRDEIKKLAVLLTHS